MSRPKKTSCAKVRILPADLPLVIPWLMIPIDLAIQIANTDCMVPGMSSYLELTIRSAS